jgi:hypothetical protein
LNALKHGLHARETLRLWLYGALRPNVAGCSGRVQRLAGWGAVGGSVVAIVLAALGGATARGVANIWTGFLLLLTVVIIVDLVLRLDSVTLQSLYAALSAYLLIGLMFAAFFSAIGNLTNTDFFVNGEPANSQTYQYFSFTTLTTLGYGDFTAGNSFGRAVAVLEIFLATLIARLVSAYRTPRRQDPPPDASASENEESGTPAG